MGDAWQSPYVDDATISDDEILYRRIKLPDWLHPTDRDAGGHPVIRGTLAFQDFTEAMAAKWGLPAPAMSVGLASVIAQQGHDASVMIAARPGYGVASVLASEVRELDQGIQRHPTETEPWHAIVFCLHRKTKNDAQKTRLGEKAAWVIPPA